MRVVDPTPSRSTRSKRARPPSGDSLFTDAESGVVEGRVDRECPSSCPTPKLRVEVGGRGVSVEPLVFAPTAHSYVMIASRDECVVLWVNQFGHFDLRRRRVVEPGPGRLLVEGDLEDEVST